MNTAIIIVMTTDESYFEYTYIAIKNIMLKSNPYRNYVFKLLVDLSITNSNRKLLKEISEDFSNCFIDFIEFKLDICVDKVFGRITEVTYARLFLPFLLPEVNKCLYVDQDIFVKKDLAEIFDYNIEDKVIAGVLNPFQNERCEELLCQINERMDSTTIKLEVLKNSTLAIKVGRFKYINAGVVLFNLDKIRKFNWWEKSLKKLIPMKWNSGDQDIINIMCNGRVFELPQKYNVMYTVPEPNPVLIHYAGILKPWNCPILRDALEWWEVCKKTKYYQLYCKKIPLSLEYASKYINIKDEKDIINECRDKKVVIYGAGIIGKRIGEYMLKHGMNVIGYAVSSINMCGDGYVNGVPVRAIDCYTQKGEDMVVIIGIKTEPEPIFKILTELKIENYFYASHMQWGKFFQERR